MRLPLDPLTIERILYYSKEFDWSTAEISLELGVTVGTIYYYLRKDKDSKLTAKDTVRKQKRIERTTKTYLDYVKEAMARKELKNWDYLKIEKNYNTLKNVRYQPECKLHLN